MLRIVVLVSLVAGASGCTTTPALPAPERYSLFVEESTPQGVQATRTIFELRSEGVERRAIIHRFEQREGESWKAVDIGADCRRQFAAPEGAIGSVRLIPAVEVNALAPVCAPEPLFGAVTDIASFANIAFDPAFRSAELKRVGDALDLPGFAATWSRPPALIEASIRSHRGRIALDAIEGRRRLISWNPGPMELVFKRDAGAGRQMVLQGIETIVLEANLDTATRRLLSGRSREDRLDLKMHLPGRKGGPEFKITRTLILEPVTQ